MLGSAGFAATSVLAAYSPNAETLIGARTLLGLFGAMLMPSTLSLLRHLFPHREQRRLAVAVWATGWAGGAALGPIVGGVLLERFWWGSVFLLAVPVLGLLLVLGPVLLPESRDPAPGRVDPVSIALSMLAMLPLVYGIKSLAHHGMSGRRTGLVGARPRGRRRLRAAPARPPGPDARRAPVPHRRLQRSRRGQPAERLLARRFPVLHLPAPAAGAGTEPDGRLVRSSYPGWPPWCWPGSRSYRWCGTCTPARWWPADCCSQASATRP
jgi:hypothetical protein